MDIFFIVFFLCVTPGVLFGLAYWYIRAEYREFCYKEALKENIQIRLKQAYSSLDYINEKYNDAMNPTHNALRKNLIPKITFILDIIKTLPLEKQDYELHFLIDILTEVFIRVEQDINNVQGIISPLNSIIQRLAREKIDYLKMVEMENI